MKAAAIFILVLCLAALGGIGYLYLNSNVTVSYAECIATDPVTQLEIYNQLTSALSAGTLIGTPFAKEPPASPEDAVFYTYTVHLENRSFLPVEIVEIQVTPLSGDVLQMGETQAYDLPAGRTMDLTATILTLKTAQNIRELTVTYYIWGLPFTARVTAV